VGFSEFISTVNGHTSPGQEFRNASELPNITECTESSCAPNSPGAMHPMLLTPKRLLRGQSASSMMDGPMEYKGPASVPNSPLMMPQVPSTPRNSRLLRGDSANSLQPYSPSSARCTFQFQDVQKQITSMDIQVTNMGARLETTHKHIIGIMKQLGMYDLAPKSSASLSLSRTESPGTSQHSTSAQESCPSSR